MQNVATSCLIQACIKLKLERHVIDLKFRRIYIETHFIFPYQLHSILEYT